MEGPTVAKHREAYNPILKSFPDSEKLNRCSIGAMLFYACLIAKSDDLAHYYANPFTIAAKLFTIRFERGEVTPEIVSKWMNELVREDLITTYEVEKQFYIEIKRCKKALRSDVALDKQFPENPSFVTDSGRVRNESGPLTQPNPTILNPTHTPAADAAGCVSFDSFWKEWPKHERKVGKAKCIRVWKRMKLDPLAEQVIACLRRCKVSQGWVKENGKFIPMPMSWLNDTPWLTDAAEMVASSAPSLESARAKLDRELAEAQRTPGRDRTVARIKFEIAQLEGKEATV